MASYAAVQIICIGARSWSLRALRLGSNGDLLEKYICNIDCILLPFVLLFFCTANNGGGTNLKVEVRKICKQREQ